jgi:hypothetical protein
MDELITKYFKDKDIKVVKFKKDEVILRPYEETKFIQEEKKILL